ncbi:MAG: hypothetical protein ACKVS8_14360, partial [Phycisphaerales bacterium]
PMGGAKLIKIDRVRLGELVRAQPDATLEELRVRLGGVRSISAFRRHRLPASGLARPARGYPFGRWHKTSAQRLPLPLNPQ